MKISEKIKKRLEENNKRFWANDNISEYIKAGEKEKLINRTAIKTTHALKDFAHLL